MRSPEADRPSQRWALVVAFALIFAAACETTPTAARWKVDLVNGNGPVQVGITTDREAWAWIVPAGARIVLLDLPEPREGGIEILSRDCSILNTTAFSSSSFTIVIEPGDAPPEVTVRLEPGAPLPGAANLDYEAWCTG